MAEYVKFSIPAQDHAALKAYAAAHDRPITWALRQAVAALTGTSSPPAAAAPATPPEPTRPEHLGDRTDYGTGAMAARLRDRSTG